MSYDCIYRYSSDVRTALFRDGLSIAQIAKKLTISEDTVRDVLRKVVLNLNKAELPKELKVFELVVLNGLSPSQAANRMGTGEEDVRGLLLNLEEDWDDSDSEGIRIHVIDLTNNISDDESESESEDTEMKAPNNLRIYFEYDEKSHDKLTVEKDMDGTYRVEMRYNQNSSQSGSQHTTFFFTNRELLRYIRNLFAMTYADDDPFHSMEMHIPGYPTVRYAPRKLKKVLPNILQAIRDNFLEV